MAMANMNLIGIFVTKLWPVQALACGGGDGGATKNIISPKFSNFGDIISCSYVENINIIGYLGAWGVGASIIRLGPILVHIYPLFYINLHVKYRSNMIKTF